ncbi:MAG TPA: cyclic-di-AMP receptor [Candidatus Limnocylindria bacterium]|nr:cyclic-di-AMP receptor [Candidatus Limnocylindria bacterium]
MAKLLFAILHQLDAENVVTALEEDGHRLTRIPSFGGFLGVENVTLLMAVEEEKLDDVVGVIESYTSGREMELPLVVQGRLKDELPRMIRYGGATILIANLESVRHLQG